MNYPSEWPPPSAGLVARGFAGMVWIAFGCAVRACTSGTVVQQFSWWGGVELTCIAYASLRKKPVFSTFCVRLASLIPL